MGYFHCDECGREFVGDGIPNEHGHLLCRACEASRLTPADVDTAADPRS